MSRNLKSCPFCGWETELKSPASLIMVQCGGCSSVVSFLHGVSRDAVISLYNKRAHPAAQEKQG